MALRAPRLWLAAPIVLTLGILAVPVVDSHAASRSFRGIKLAEGPAGLALRFDLDWSFRYETHSPARTGTILEIRLRPQDARALDGRRASELITWTQRELVPLADVELTLAPDGRAAVLRLRFEQGVDFRVRQLADLHSVIVDVSQRPAAPPRAAPMQPARSGLSSQRGSPEGDGRVGEIIEEGRAAVKAGELDRAILLFTKALSDPTHPRAPEAKELLGLAYQRKGQPAHAHSEYSEYLETYPDAEGAARVRQRIEALLTANAPAQRTRELPREPEPESEFDHRFDGSVSQFYRMNVLDTSDGGSETLTSALDSDFFLGSQHTGRRLSVRTNLAGSYSYDFQDDREPDETRISSAYLDLRALENRFTLRLGRQSATGGGVLGRFDGITTGVRLTDSWRVNLVSGFLVDFADSNSLNSNRPFYGAAVQIGTLFEHWDGEIYAIRQLVDGIEDRTAAGAQLRFFASRGSLLAAVDYELSYSDLNSAMLIGNWQLTDRTSVNAFFDLRKSPALTTFNALQGQGVDDIDDLEDIYSEREIRELAEDRTATSRMATLGLSHSLNPTWQLGGDFTVSNTTGTEASGGVDATPRTGTEYALAFRAGASGLLVEGGFTSLSLRYSTSDTSTVYLANLSGRYAIIDSLRLGPRLIVELRDGATRSRVWVYRPSLRLDYRWRRSIFELEAGVDFSKGTANDADEDETEYFWQVGYRQDF